MRADFTCTTHCHPKQHTGFCCNQEKEAVGADPIAAAAVEEEAVNEQEVVDGDSDVQSTVQVGLELGGRDKSGRRSRGRGSRARGSRVRGSRDGT